MLARILSYFNTTKETGTKLQENVAKAKAQEKIILQLFKDNPNKMYSGSMVQKETGYLIVSCRRVITTLNKKGEIVRVGKMVCPETNSSEYTYMLQQKNS
jgi:hypothetical protein